MLAVRDGDLDKLGLLFEKYHKKLYHLFLWQTRDTQASEDMVQDVFMKILKYRHTYRGDGKFTTWMFSVAHSVKADFYRKNRKSIRSLDEAQHLSDNEPSPEQVAEKKDEASLIQTALSKLPDDKRELLLMSRFQNMKYAEIAEITGCAIGTIKSRIHWTLKELTLIYQELTEENPS